jgi:hypothetical protein
MLIESGIIPLSTLHILSTWSGASEYATLIESSIGILGFSEIFLPKNGY